MSQTKNTVTEAEHDNINNRTDEDLVYEIQAGINTEKNLLELWERSKFFAKAMIKNLVGPLCVNDANYEEYLQECFIAVMLTAKRYEHRGGKFKTVLYFYIKLCLSSYNGSTFSCVRIPDSMKRIIKRYKVFVEQYKEENNGKKPSDQQIRESLKLKKNDYIALMVAIKNVSIASIDEYINTDGFSLSEILESEEKLEATVCHSVYLKELHDALKDALAIVPEKTKLMIISVYYNGASIDQVAESFGISKLTVRNNIRNGFDRILLDGKTRHRLESFMSYGYTYDIDKLIEKKNKTRDYHRTLYRESKDSNNMTI